MKASLFASLPAELFNSIVLYTLDFPTKVRHSCDSRRCGGELFESPLLAVNRSFREECLNIVARSGLWISLEVKTERDMAKFRQFVLGGVPILPTKFYNLIRDRSPTSIQIVLGNPKDLTAETLSSSENSNYLVPYNLASFLKLWMALMDHWRSLYDFSINIPMARTREQTQLLDNEVVQTLHLNTRWAAHPDLDVPWRREQIDGSSKRIKICRRARSLERMIRHMNTIKRYADDLERRGLRDEASIWLGYHGADDYGYHMVSNGILPRHWTIGYYDPNTGFSLPSGARFGRNPTGNRVRSLTHELEYRACIGYWELYNRYSSNFLKIHHNSLTRSGSRWSQAIYSSFGLSDIERAQLHHIRAITSHINVTALSMFIDPSINDRLSKSEARPFYYRSYEKVRPSEHHSQSVKNIEIACQLDPDNAEFEEFLKYVHDSTKGYIERFPDDEDAKRMEECRDRPRKDYTVSISQDEYPNAGVTQWVGDSDWLDGWGGPAILQYLPLAQRKESLTEEEEEELYRREQPTFH